MNYVPLSSPRKILQPLPWQPLNNEQVTAMLLVTVTPWLKGVFIGIGRDGSLSHRRPVSLHTPDHAHSPPSRDVTVTARPPSGSTGPPDSGHRWTRGKPTPRFASSSCTRWPVPPRHMSLPWGLGPRPARFPKRRQAEDRRHLQEPFENSPWSSAHQKERHCPRCTISLSNSLLIMTCLAALDLSYGAQGL